MYRSITILKFFYCLILTVMITLYLSIVYQNCENVMGFFGFKQLSVLPQKKPPLILAWTNFFSNNLADLIHDELRECDFYCTVTDDKRIADSADVLVFHIRDFDTLVLPPNRASNQLYVFVSFESPHHTGFHLSLIPKNFFNLTLTYRRDSDIFSPYGALRKIDEDTPKNQIWNWKEVKKIARSKTGMALQLVSNCETPSRRESYVEQLKFFLDVTQRGKCNKVSCDEECAANLTAKHRFYLAFENSVCRDYITEKLFQRSLENLLVPIVLKKSLYKDTLPPGSFIAVDDFASPRDLARYLKHLAKNFTAYLSYLEWTKHYQKAMDTNGFCTLCKYLHEHANDGRSKIISDINSWWHNGGQCVNDYASQFLKTWIQAPAPEKGRINFEQWKRLQILPRHFVPSVRPPRFT